MPVKIREQDRLLTGQIVPTMREYVRVNDGIVQRVRLETIESLIQRGALELAPDRLGYTKGRFAPFLASVRGFYDDMGSLYSNSFPDLRDQARGIYQNPQFDPLAPRSLAYVGHNSDRIMNLIRDSVVNSLQYTISQGFSEGASVNEVALRIAGRVNTRTRRREGGILGLDERRTIWVAAVRRDLARAKGDGLEDVIGKTGISAAVRREIEALADGERLPPWRQRRILVNYSNQKLIERGRTIARTELLNAREAAKAESVQQAIDSRHVDEFTTMKVWDAILDGRTRQWHWEADGQTQLSDGLFAVGPDQTPYPGHPSMSASNRVNCRCAVRYARRKPDGSIEWL